MTPPPLLATSVCRPETKDGYSHSTIQGLVLYCGYSECFKKKIGAKILSLQQITYMQKKNIFFCTKLAISSPGIVPTGILSTGTSLKKYFLPTDTLTDFSPARQIFRRQFST